MLCTYKYMIYLDLKAPTEKKCRGGAVQVFLTQDVYYIHVYS